MDRKRLIALAAVGAVALAGCGGGTEEEAGGGARVDGGALVVALPTAEAGDVKSLDPGIGGGAIYAHTINGTMFDQLVYQDPKTGEVVPGIAERWEVSPDGLKYRFHLRTGPKFWDGTPVTAEDVKYTLDRAVDKQYLPGNAYTSSLMANYQRSVITGPSTVEVVLQRPQANFLPSAMGRDYLGIVPKAYVEKVGVRAFAEKPMGSGPFKFVEWAHNSHITVEKNPDYAWGPKFFETAGRAPSVDRITFRFIPEDSTRVAALESGQVNMVIVLPPFDQDRLQNNNQLEVITVRKNGQPGVLNLQTQRFPTSELAVRRAISYAVDRQAINKTVFADKNFPAYHMLEERMGEWLNKDARFPDHDVERAKQILEDDGWTVGPNGIRQKDGRPLVLDGMSSPEVQQAMTLVQAQLKEAGMQLDVRVVSRAQHSATLQGGGEYNVAWGNPIGWTNEDPHLLFSLNHSRNVPPRGTSNESRVSVPEIDRLLETAAVTGDRAERKRLYHEAQRLLVDYVPVVPTLSFNRNICVTRGVHGIVPDMRGTYTYFHDAWLSQSLHGRWK
jgi:peptide/nickel transport system substrate-binding protein